MSNKLRKNRPQWSKPVIFIAPAKNNGSAPQIIIIVNTPNLKGSNKHTPQKKVLVLNPFDNIHARYFFFLMNATQSTLTETVWSQAVENIFNLYVEELFKDTNYIITPGTIEQRKEIELKRTIIGPSWTQNPSIEPAAPQYAPTPRPR